MIERIKHIMSSFFDKEAVTECEEIKSGLINATYRVKVGIKNYILQRLNIDVFANPELIQNNLDLLDSYLNNHNSNYKLITPLSNKSGDKLTIDSDGNCYRIFEFIEDSKRIFVVSKKPTWEEYKRMAIIIGLGIIAIGLMGFIIYFFFALSGLGK